MDDDKCTGFVEDFWDYEEWHHRSNLHHFPKTKGAGIVGAQVSEKWTPSPRSLAPGVTLQARAKRATGTGIDG